MLSQDEDGLHLQQHYLFPVQLLFHRQSRISRQVNQKKSFKSYTTASTVTRGEMSSASFSKDVGRFRNILWLNTAKLSVKDFLILAKFNKSSSRQTLKHYAGSMETTAMSKMKVKPFVLVANFFISIYLGGDR